LEEKSGVILRLRAEIQDLEQRLLARDGALDAGSVALDLLESTGRETSQEISALRDRIEHLQVLSKKDSGPGSLDLTDSEAVERRVTEREVARRVAVSTILAAILTQSSSASGLCAIDLL
jgi:hypothetical protein